MPFFCAKRISALSASLFRVCVRGRESVRSCRKASRLISQNLFFVALLKCFHLVCNKVSGSKTQETRC